MTAPLIVVQPPSAQPAAAPAGPVHFLSGGDAAALGLERLLLRAERLHRDRRLRRVAHLDRRLPRSVVLDQAENRLYVQQAVLLELLPPRQAWAGAARVGGRGSDCDPPPPLTCHVRTTAAQGDSGGSSRQDRGVR